MEKFKVPTKEASAKQNRHGKMLRIWTEHHKKVSAIAKRTKRSMTEVVGMAIDNLE